MIGEGMYHVKENVPESLQVEYKGASYYPDGYQLAFNSDGTVRHTAILHDLTVASLVYAPLKDVNPPRKANG